MMWKSLEYLVIALATVMLAGFEYLDMAGRLDVLEQRHPKLWRFANSRPARLLLLVLCAGLLAKDAAEVISVPELPPLRFQPPKIEVLPSLVEHENHMTPLSNETAQIELATGTSMLPPNGLFQTGIKPVMWISSKNVTSYLAEHESSIGMLEMHDSARTKDGIPSSTRKIEDEVWDAFEKDKPEEVAEGTMTGGQMTALKLEGSHQLSEDEVRELKAGNKLMYLVGYSKWKDGSGGPHERRFCCFVLGDTNPAPFIQCLGHNDFLRKAKD